MKFSMLAFYFLLLFSRTSAVAEPGPEPSFNGKPLSEWIRVAQPNQSGLNMYEQGVWEPARTPQQIEAAAAIRQIGTNALPTILVWLDSKIDPHPAMLGLKELGELGAQPLEPLFGRLKRSDHLNEIDKIIQVLGYMGPVASNALPLILKEAKGGTSCG